MSVSIPLSHSLTHWHTDTLTLMHWHSTTLTLKLTLTLTHSHSLALTLTHYLTVTNTYSHSKNHTGIKSLIHKYRYRVSSITANQKRVVMGIMIWKEIRINVTGHLGFNEKGAYLQAGLATMACFRSSVATTTITNIIHTLAKYNDFTWLQTTSYMHNSTHVHGTIITFTWQENHRYHWLV